MYDLINNVPIPRSKRPTPPARRKYDFKNMEINQMHFVPGKSKNSLSTHASTMGKKLQRKFVTRTIWMREDMENGLVACDKTEEGAIEGVGIWRTE